MKDPRILYRGTYLQFNLQNVFDEFYFGNLSTQIRASDNPNFLAQLEEALDQ